MPLRTASEEEKAAHPGAFEKNSHNQNRVITVRRAAMSSYSFALVSHSTALCDSVRRVVASEKDVTMRYEVSTLGGETECAETMLADGVEVILCYGGTTQLLRRSIGHSLAIIPRSDLDLMQGLMQARTLSKHVALSTNMREKINLALMEELLGMRIMHIPYATWDELLEGVERACAANVRTIVGGGLSCGCMERHGGRGIIVEPSANAIRDALEQAKAIAGTKREENARHSDLLAVLQQLDEGVICISATGEVLFCNSQAFRMLKLPNCADISVLRAYFDLFSVDAVLADGVPVADALVSTGGDQFMAGTFPLPFQAGHRGVVILFRDITSLQNMDRKIRSELYSRGFISRHTSRDIKGASPAVSNLKEKIRRYAAAATASVHIYGETGAGKELTAHALHAESERRDKPFVVANCSALPESLLESELFGYEEGAFTGAKRGGKAGLFELANQGVLFLDEIGDINHAVQLRLLRVLEAKELMRIGGDRVVPVDVRIISASHKPLMDLVREGSFRSDLYFRLVVLQLAQPPLRKRIADIPLLLENLLARHGKNAAVLSPAILERMRSYDWPGNIRELFSITESYLILLEGDQPNDELFFDLFTERTSNTLDPEGNPALAPIPGQSLKDKLEHTRGLIVRETLRACRGDRQEAARKLKVSYNTLWRILR